MREYLIALISTLATCFIYAQDNGVKSLSWLTGTWKMETKTGIIYEVWQQVDANTLQSKSFKVKSTGDTSLLETANIINKDGHLYYIPTVEGQNNNKPVTFHFTIHDRNSFIAENPGHDFPKKVHYILEGPDKLIAVVSGLHDGVEKKQVYSFGRQQ